MGTAVCDVASGYIKRAKKGQEFLHRMTQEEVDKLAHACGKAVYDNAKLLAQKAVLETGLGNVHDKILKKRSKAEATWTEIKDKRTVGIIKRDHAKRMIYYADPVGVVAGVAPCTNPISTAMFYTMICIKTRNSLIISPHPKAIESTFLTIKTMMDAMAFAGIPAEVIQVLYEPELTGSESLMLASEVMSMANMVVATGGPKLVDVAYHSGTPAYGVGAGNTPVYIHHSCNIAEAIEKIVTGRSFDNGIICASEQHIISPFTLESPITEALEASKAYVIKDRSEWTNLTETIFDVRGHLKAEYIGKPATFIAERACLNAPKDCRALVVPTPTNLIGQDPYTAEKLCPILSWFSVKDLSEGINVAVSLLNFQGKGHSAAIHIDEDRFEEDLLNYSERMPATHVIVNMAAATSSGGGRYNWLTPSTTLGCGSYGGTMPMESINLSVKQLINFKAVAMPLGVSRIPERLFG